MSSQPAFRVQSGVLYLETSLTYRTVAELQGAVQPHLTQVDTVDLSGVEEADSASLALFLDWQRNLPEGRRLAFQAVPPGLQELASLYDVDGLLAFPAASAVSAVPLHA